MLLQFKKYNVYTFSHSIHARTLHLRYVCDLSVGTVVLSLTNSDTANKTLVTGGVISALALRDGLDIVATVISSMVVVVDLVVFVADMLGGSVLGVLVALVLARSGGDSENESSNEKDGCELHIEKERD